MNQDKPMMIYIYIYIIYVSFENSVIRFVCDQLRVTSYITCSRRAH